MTTLAYEKTPEFEALHEVTTDGASDLSKLVVAHTVELPDNEDPRFDQLRSLLQELASTENTEESINLITEMDAIALQLHDKFEADERRTNKSLASLYTAWEAINVWDKARTPGTRKLAAQQIKSYKTMNNIKNGPGMSLSNALEIATERNIPFDVALDEYNATR